MLQFGTVKDQAKTLTLSILAHVFEKAPFPAERYSLRNLMHSHGARFTDIDLLLPYSQLPCLTVQSGSQPRRRRLFLHRGPLA